MSKYSSTNRNDVAMQVGFWGPAGWKFLHSVAYGYPSNPTQSEKVLYENFFRSVGKVLPCNLCRESYGIFLTELPIKTGSRRDLTAWLWEIHNKVNTKLHRHYKNTDLMSIDKTYNSYRAKCSNNNGLGCTDPLLGGPLELLKVFRSSSLFFRGSVGLFIFCIIVYIFLHIRRKN